MIAYVAADDGRKVLGVHKDKLGAGQRKGKGWLVCPEHVWRRPALGLSCVPISAATTSVRNNLSTLNLFDRPGRLDVWLGIEKSMA